MSRRGRFGWCLASLFACAGPESVGQLAGSGPSSDPPVAAIRDPGGGHPVSAPETLVIPADEPQWAHLSGLLDHPRAYGEASWDDVRMRVVQHVATIARDRARVYAGRGDFAACAVAYTEGVASIRAVRTSGRTGAPIKAALEAAAARDAALCDALARDMAPAVASTPVAGLRARYYALVLRARAGTDVRAAAEAVAAELRAVPAPVLDLDRFDDFEARHALRVALVEAAVDAVDPLRPAEPWGYWEPSEVVAVAEGLARAADRLAAGETVADPWDVAPPRAPLAFTAEGLGALPTGDSLVDVAGFPGPRAIGRLAVRSLGDPAHRAWLEALAARLGALPDAQVPAAVAAAAAELDAHPEGSRYYNVKAVRNHAVRVLASRGAYAEARAVLAASWPLHAQDWACPDRAGILRAIDGRLAVVGGAPDALEVLDRARAETETMLAHTAVAERAGGAGPRGAGPPPPHESPSPPHP